jgi:hypothetical protein
MPQKSYRSLLSAIAILILFTACKSKNITPTEQGPAVSPPQTTTVAVQATTAPVQIKETEPPEQLEIIRSNSANIVFDVIKLDWERTAERFAAIKENMVQMKPVLEAASVQADLIGRLSTCVDNLEKSIAQKKVNESKSKANEITKYIPDIEDLYKVTVPTDLNRLSYLDREIHININQSDWDAANKNYNAAKTIWTRFASGLDKIHENLAANFSSSLEKLGKTIKDRNSKTAVLESNKILEHIGTLKYRLKN